MASLPAGRRWRWLAFALFVVQSGLSFAAVEVPAIRSHVSDYAEVLGPRGALLDSRLKAFEVSSGLQVFVLTVKTLGPQTSIEDYAVEVFRTWQLGRAGLNDGVLLVMALDERKVRIEVGYGLEGRLTDLESGRIIREWIVPSFKQGDYAGGIERGAAAILGRLHVPLAGGRPAASAPAGEAETGKWVFLFLSGVFLLFFMFMSLFAGVLGLLVMSLPCVVLPLWLYPDWRGYLFVALFLALWLGGRGCLLAHGAVVANVRKYHLKGSRHPALAWLGVYLFMLGNGHPGSLRRRGGGRGGGSRSGSSSSFSSSSRSSGAGGSSGGGGASGSW